MQSLTMSAGASLGLTHPLGRVARVGAFALETWTRLALAGATDPRERAQELSWVAENACALHGVRIHVEGRIPRGAAVLVANHISYFDPVVISSLVPCAPVAKREVASWPLVGELSRRLGVMWVERGNALSGARVLRQACRALEDDVPVLVFPEGTTTRGNTVLPLKRGMFGAAALASVPVIPVAIAYERLDAAWVGDDSFLPHYAKSIATPCTRVSVRFLDALSAAHDAPERVAELARARIEQSLARGHFATIAPRAAWSSGDDEPIAAVA